MQLTPSEPKGIEAVVALVAVDTNEEAQRLLFPGSPTIRLHGENLFPVEDRGTWPLGYRTYQTPEGLMAGRRGR